MDVLVPEALIHLLAVVCSLDYGEVSPVHLVWYDMCIPIIHTYIPISGGEKVFLPP